MRDTRNTRTVAGRFATSCALKQNFKRAAGVLQALAGFGFAEQTLMHGLASEVIDSVCGLQEGGVNAGELKVIVDLMEQVAKRWRMPVAASDKARQIGRKLLLDGFFHNRAAHDSACRVQAKEVAARG